MDHMCDGIWWGELKYVLGKLPQCNFVREIDPVRDNILVIWQDKHLLSQI
jgi:hypothetical protein